MHSRPGVRLRNHCSVGEECPALHRHEGGGIEVTGELIERPGLPDGEAVVLVPDSLLPEVADMQVANLGDYIRARHVSDLLRVQVRGFYNVASDADDFRRYMRGASEPAAAGKQAWLDKLAADRAAGKIRRNVHVIHGPLSDYLRYQFEWGYVPNVAAGQDIRILEVRSDTMWERFVRIGDYNVIESKYVVRLRYDNDDSYLGAVQVSDDAVEGFAAAAEMAWALATPFTQWWAAHPQYHRDSRAA